MTKFSPQLRVAHLSTTHEGGAGLAARRLNLALNSQGIESTFYALRKSGYIPSLTEYSIQRTGLNRILSKVNASFQSKLNRKIFFSLWSVSPINLKYLKSSGIHQDTILHFHNWFNLISLSELAKLQKAGYKIVLTLHDERIFTGGCHYTLECRGFESGCGTCPFIAQTLKAVPRRNLKKAKKFLTSDQNRIKLVAPSNWIAQEFAKSLFAASFKVEVISNVHADLEYVTAFHPINKKVRIGYASMYAKSWIKGFDIVEILQQESEQSECNLEFVFLSNYLDAESTKSLFWKDIDFLLVPSRMDNSPNVIHEARLNGIPLIASQVGGISELLNKEVDILIDVENFSPSALMSQILQYRWDGSRKKLYKGIQLEHRTVQINSLNRLISLYLS